ncbi:MAG: YihY/virulence factor BrkB family protein [Neomegalonema sp.]|nr:YihY/virulence factor BrkB family protein [Neomegalonema sp.]
MIRRIKYVYAVFMEALRRFADDDHAVYSGHMAFTLLLSFGPFVVCAILLSMQFDPNAAIHLASMIKSLEASALVPKPMAELMVNVVQGVAPNPEMVGSSSNIITIVITAVIGLYAGSSAFEAARNGFNEAYDTRDKRNVVFRRAQTYLLSIFVASLFVAASILFVTLTVGFDIFGLIRSGASAIGIADTIAGGVLVAFFALFVGAVFCTLLLGVHITLPRGYVKRWRLYVWAQDEIDDIRAAEIPLVPGVLWSAFMWVCFAVVYSIALRTVVDFGKNHGALAGVVATLLFFYISATMIFLGAQINIAIATIGKNGEPKWPHPMIDREDDFDETKEPAYQVLVDSVPDRQFLRLWHYLRGGGACEKPEHHVDALKREREERAQRKAAKLARKQDRARRRAERRAQRSGGATPSPAPGE